MGIDPDGVPRVFQTDPGGVVEEVTLCAAGAGGKEMAKILESKLDAEDGSTDSTLQDVARELARKIADNAPFSNYLMIQSLPRIANMSQGDGLFTESLAAAMSQTSEGAKEGLRAFLEKRPPKFR